MNEKDKWATCKNCGTFRNVRWPCECAVLRREQQEIKASKAAGRRID